MAGRSASFFDLWMAPYEAVTVMRNSLEIARGTRDVVAKRLPTIVEAILSPWTADFKELSLMISEKVDAVAVSSRSVAKGQRRLSGAIEGQASALRRLASAGWLSPMEWWDVGERNLLIATTLMGVPGEMLAPFHKGVTGNVQRLGA